MRSLLASAVLLALLPAAAAAEDLQPGQYQTTITSDIPGDKTKTDSHCVTQKDVDSGLTQLGVEKEQGCKTHDFKRGPGSVSYRVVCGSGAESNSMQMAGTFTRDTFDMKMQMQLEPKAKPNTIHMVGKRIGACSGK